MLSKCGLDLNETESVGDHGSATLLEIPQLKKQRRQVENCRLNNASIQSVAGTLWVFLTASIASYQNTIDAVGYLSICAV